MKYIVSLFLILFFNGCILLDLANLPVISNPDGSEVKSEILETSNLITTIGYLMYFSQNPGPGPASAFTEASLTDVILIRSLQLKDDAHYDRKSVDKCKDYMSVSSFFMHTILNPMTSADVINSLNDNILIAFSLTQYCKIEKGKVLIGDGENGI